MQNNENLLEIKENEISAENLSPYDRWQLERFGSIDAKCNPEEESEISGLTTSELNYIFDLENPAI